MLTEKPIAIDPRDGREMIDTARACGRQLGVVFQNRYITGIRETKRLIEQGRLGDIGGAWSQLNWWRPPSYYECDWKGTWAKEGGRRGNRPGHPQPRSGALPARPARAERAGAYRHPHPDRNRSGGGGGAAIVFENGAVYSFFASNYYTSNSPIRIEISGEKGTALLTGDSVTLRLAGEAERTIPMEDVGIGGGEDYWGSCHRLMLKDFYRALAAGEPVPVDPEDALKTLELVQAVYRSSRENAKLILS